MKVKGKIKQTYKLTLTQDDAYAFCRLLAYSEQADKISDADRKRAIIWKKLINEEMDHVTCIGG